MRERDGSVNLTADQRTKIKQTVLTERNVPRVNNVNFSIRVGTPVPRHVRVVTVPPALIEINPRWRGHSYFVVQEEIIIVDDRREIVAVVPVDAGAAGTAGATAPGTAAAPAAGGALNLGREEIREVQLILVRKGYDIEVDGMFGPSTREALIKFQRQEGLQATGQIDSRTMGALGLRQGGEPAASGQGGGQQREQGAAGTSEQPSPSRQGQSDTRPSPSTGQQGTTGQSGDRMERLPANREGQPGRDNQPGAQPRASGADSGSMSDDKAK